MRVTLSSAEFTEIEVTQGTLQNLSPQAAIEIATEENENSGIVLYPRQKLTFSHETTVYARSVWDTVTDGETVVLAVEPIFNQAEGGGGESGGGGTPVGTIISFMGTTAPEYYLACDDTMYNIADYPELAQFFNVHFGSANYFGGDGVTTFAVPDLRGEFLRGTGTNSHADNGDGANVGVHQDGTEIPTIAIGNGENVVIPQSTNSTDINSTKRDSERVVDGSGYGIGAHYTSGLKWPAPATVANIYTSRPTNTSVLYCIKAKMYPTTVNNGDPVGRVVFDVILRDGYIRADGAAHPSASVNYPRLITFLNEHPELIAADAAAYAANVGLYLYDSGTDELTLPNYIGRTMQGGNSVESIEAGVPNIKGSFSVWFSQSDGATVPSLRTGAFYNGAVGTKLSKMSVTSSQSDPINPYTYFDASHYSSLYSDSVNTVQPPAITMIPQIKY